jgi:pantoate--beta-alanine ligase
MHIVSSPAEMQAWSVAKKKETLSVGFVPTMGALHAGHMHLVDTSRSENEATVLSIFVNPLQFNESSDFEKYPRTVERDIELAEEHGVECVFLPTAADMYPPHATVRVKPGSAAEGMEGEMRPGHFEGVTTIVAKLFNCVLPDRAYFGKKDYQQLAVIRQMARDLDFPVEVLGIDTVREHDGLALSSRNTRLDPRARAEAPVIFRALSRAVAEHLSGRLDAVTIRGIVQTELNSSGHVRTEYVSVVDRQSLQPVESTRNGAVVCVAAWLGDVRLIDNIELPPV